MSATTDVIISRKTFADTIEGLCRHFDIDLEFFEERNAFGEGLPTSAANADIKKRHITTPYPETASSFAIALHEIGEVTMADLHRKGEPRSWQELRATKFARGCA
ncbi:MAG: hypothetical protein ACXVH1_39525, partial [Solirubrobacteraceae bacterium]